MSVSASRLEQLRTEFIPVKNQIDKIDRKYSLDYNEPLVDMPESLDLPKLSFTPKTEQELRALADEQTYASYLAELRRLQSSKAANDSRIDKQIANLEERARETVAKLLKTLNEGTEDIKKKMTDYGLMFSTVFSRVQAQMESDYETKVNDANTSADNKRQALEDERQALEAKHEAALTTLQAQHQAQIDAAYTKLLNSQNAEKTRVDKYNTQLDEKEKKYLMARAKALESAKQAEYSRSFAARKLYQQMGAVGYEESMLWEKYNVFVKHFSNFTKREEALTLIQIDAYVQGHLKQYYSTLIDWVNRNVPA